jgi:hypothetical protein
VKRILPQSSGAERKVYQGKIRGRSFSDSASAGALASSLQQ